MKNMKANSDSIESFLAAFVKWVLISGVLGILGGAAGTLFHICVDKATAFRLAHGSILWFLPLGGIAIAALYSLSGLEGKGTDYVLRSVYTDGKVPAAMAPVIFVSTVITHLFGGSAGREGAALQLGGSLGSQVVKLLKLDEHDMQVAIMCGMSTVFAALFGTPLTAAFFAMEVSNIGIMHYSSLIPCIVSAFTASDISTRLGVQPVYFTLTTTPEASAFNMGKTGVLAALCAVLSIVFCLTMRATGKLLNKLFKNRYTRVAAGGALIIALTLLCGTREYNGAGMDVIKRAISGQAVAYAFVLKMVFTAITLESGYKGGEIVPTFFIGATFGCVVGGVLRLDPGFSAAIGMIAMFCGAVNCPVASIMLSIEVFGGRGLGFFAIACAISYMLSGYFSIYSSQRIVYSKLKNEIININAH